VLPLTQMTAMLPSESALLPSLLGTWHFYFF